MADPADRTTPPPSSPPTRSGRSERRSRRRRALRVGLGGLAVLVAAGSMAGWWALRTDAGRAWLLATVLDAVNGAAPVTVSAARLDGALPGRLRLVDLTVADDAGIWLSADRIGLDWHPMALLGGRLHVAAITASALSVDRAPVLPSTDPPPDDSGGGIDLRLLGALQVDRIALDGVFLGPELVGEAVLMEGSGHLGGPAGSDQALTAALTARRIDGRPGIIDLRARLHGPDRDRLAATVSAREAKGGALSMLAGLPDAAGWSVTLDGDGPLDAWTGRLTAEAEGLATLGGRVDLDLGTPTAPALDLDLTADPGAAAPPTWRAVLTERLALRLSAALSPDGAALVETLSLSTQALTVDGGASVDPAAGTLAARLSADLTNPGLLAPWVALPLAAGTLTLTAEGPLAAPVVTLAADLDEPGPAAIGAKTLSLTATATPDGPLDASDATVHLLVEGQAGGLRGPDVVTALLPHPLDLSAEGTLAVAGRTLDLTTLRLADAHGLSLTLSGRAGLAPALSASAAAHLDVATLERLAPVLGGLSPTGSGVLTLSDVTVTDDLRVAGDLSLRLADAALGLPAADGPLGPSPVLTAGVTYSPADGVRAERITLDGAALALTGAASLPADFATVQADLTAVLDDLGLVAGGAVGGAVTLKAAISGPLADPAVTATARLPTATLAGQAWDDVRLEAQAEALAGGPSGSLALTGRGPGGAVSLESRFALPAYARATLDDLVATVPGARLTGQTRSDLATLHTEGAVTVQVTDAAALAPWGLPALSGSADATVTLSAGPERAGQQVALTLEGRGLGLPDSGLALGTLTADATLSDVLGTPALRAEATLSGGEAGGLAWDRLVLGADGPLSDLGVTLSLTGSGPTGALSLASAARVVPPSGSDAGQVRLDRLDLETGGHALRLTRPATLSLGADGTRVDRLDLSVDDGRLTVRGGQGADGALDVAVEGADLPLALAGLAMPDQAPQGRLDLTATLAGRLPTPRGSFSVQARDVRLEADSGVPPLSAGLSGQLQGGRLQAEAEVRGFAETPATATVDLPLRLGGGAPIPPNAPLSARVDWAGPVGRVWEMLPLIEHRLAGDLTLHAALAGSLAAPQVEAEVRLAQGRYEHLTAGTVIEDLSLTAAASGTDRVTVSLSGTDGESGRLSGDGDVRLTETGPAGAVTVQVQNARVVRRDDVTARADADLSIRLDGDRGAIEGRIETQDVRVRLVGVGAASVTTLEVVEIDDPAATGLSALDRASAQTDAGPGGSGAGGEAGSDAGSGAFPVALDIAVAMPNRIYVTGQGLESEWQGDLSIGGTAAAPRLTGTIRVLRGTLDVVGRAFVIETGEVRFAGGDRINPLLDVVALFEADDLEARVGVRGPADDPELVLESIPPLPRDEVVSEILFGKRSGQLTTLETVQLARAMASLSGLGDGGGPGLVDALRTAVGLDVLRVGGQGLEAGTYLGDDIYVGLEQGLDAGSGGVTVEVDLGAGFKVESRAGRSGTGEVGVMWRKDY